MTKDNLYGLMNAGIGVDIECDDLMLRSLDGGDFAVSYKLNEPYLCWEKEFDEENLHEAIDFFLCEKEKL